MKITIKEAVGWIDAEIAWCEAHRDEFVPTASGETATAFIGGLRQAKWVIAGIPSATPKNERKSR